MRDIDVIYNAFCHTIRRQTKGQRDRDTGRQTNEQRSRDVSSKTAGELFQESSSHANFSDGPCIRHFKTRQTRTKYLPVFSLCWFSLYV